MSRHLVFSRVLNVAIVISMLLGSTGLSASAARTPAWSEPEFAPVRVPLSRSARNDLLGVSPAIGDSVLAASNSPHAVYLPFVARGRSTGESVTVAPGKGGSLTSPDGRVLVEVPAGSVTYRTTISFQPLPARNVPGYQSTGLFFELTAQDELGNPVSRFARDLRLTVRYDDTADLNEDDLALYYMENDTWQRVPSLVHPDANQVVATLDHFTQFALLSRLSNNWYVGSEVGLCAGTQIRYGSGFQYAVHTTVPEDDWRVVVIDGPRYIDGEIWWDISRKEAGDPSGGTGWVYQRQADSCLGGGGGGGGGGMVWEVGEIVYLCEGTEIRHGPLLAVHTTVPVDDWAVMVIDGPRYVDGQTWWDTSRKEAGDPSGGTGWVSQQQAEASCQGGGGGGYLGPSPLSPALRAALRLAGVIGGHLGPFFVADPVYPPTGNFAHQSTDLDVPGIDGLDLVLQRTYNSVDPRDDGLFGAGWSSLLDTSLRLANDGSVDVRYPDGHGVYFMAEGDAYVPGQDGILDTLTYDGAGFELTTPDQTAYLFDADGYLTTIRDRHDNVIALERDGGHVTRIVDTGGREYTLTYDGDHVAAIGDPSGRTLYYGYAGDDLVSFTDGNGGVHRYEYEDHQLTRLTDPENITYLQNVYDGERRVVEQIDASGSSSYFNYDTEGETIFTDNLGHRAWYRYDDLSRVTEVEDALGYKEGFVYDDDYNLTSYTDKRSNTWTYTYDDRGNRLTEDGPLSWHFAYTYNEANDLTGVTDALDRTTTYVWENGNLVRVERPDTTAWTYTYDDHGQVRTATDPNTNTTYFGYDPYGNLEETRSPMGCITRYGFDIVGRMTSMTDGNGHAMQVEYDGNDNITHIVDPRQHDTWFEYDGNDCLVEMTDRRGGEWRYGYDENLKLVSETDPEGHETTHAYDKMYNRVSTTDPRENKTTFRYDALYRLEEVEDALHNVTHYEYDPNDNLIKIVDALENSTRMEYDELNRLVLVVDALLGETEFHYDEVGRLRRLVNPREAPTRYEYDAVDQLILVVDALLGETGYEYDDAGNLTAVTDANDHTTHLTYDADNRLVEQKDPEEHITTYGYDCVGNLVRLVDARTNPTDFVYDENDNLTLVVDALDGETAYAYDAEDDPISVTDPNHNTTRFLRDRDGLLERLIEAGGQVTRFEYDEAHNLIKLVNAKGNATDFEYDELNRLVASVDPLIHRTSYAYDELSRLVAVTDANLVTTRYEHDPLDRLTAVVQNSRPRQPADHETNVRTAYTYDPVGNLRTIADANGHVTEFQYDLLDRLIRETNPIESTWRYGYDPVGNLQRRIDANGIATDYAYDDDDLLVGIHYPGDEQVTFGYDATHNQVRMTDGLGVTRNTYDALNRLTSSTNHLGQRVAYAYDPASNRIAVTYPDERVARYEYDTNNRVYRVVDPDGDVFSVEYDPTHNVTAIQYPNRTQALMTYDDADRLTSVINRQTLASGKVVPISTFAYTLDPVGNRTHSDEYYGWRQPETLSHDYAYDPLYRLVGSQDSEGRSTTYAYDAVGNRLQMASNYDPLRTRPEVNPYTVDYAYNAANQLLTTDHSVFGVTEYTYDANGNRVRRQGPHVWIGNTHDRLRTDYTYDYENRLAGVKNYYDPGNDKWRVRDESAMTYDGYGRLFRRLHDDHQGGGGQKWVDFVYDGLDPIVEYVDPSPQYVNYYRGLSRILEMHDYKSQESPAGTAYYFHHDGLGSVSALTKHRGQAAHTYHYWDYGMALDVNDRTADSSNFENPHNHYAYTGQNWDDETALYHFYAREYDPVAGVWLQQDLYRGRLAEPIALHRYGYVGENPISYVDTYGFDRTKTNVSESIWPEGIWHSTLALDDAKEAAASASLKPGVTFFGLTTWLDSFKKAVTSLLARYRDWRAKLKAPPTAQQLLENQVVQTALQEAWRDSQVNDPVNRHEEGGWIIWNRFNSTIRIVRFARGNKSSISLGDRPSDTPAEQVVGTFHTHPSPAVDEQGVSYQQGPSSQDVEVANSLNLPGLLISRNGTEAYGPSKAPRSLGAPVN